MTVALDSAAGTVPSTLHFVGFSAIESFGTVTVTSSNAAFTAGQNISIVANEISCTLQPLTVSLDGTSHTPSSIEFTGFTTTESAGQIVIQAPAGGGSRVFITPGSGIDVSGSGSTNAIANTKPAPAYQCIASDATQATYQPDAVSTLVFQNFTKSFLSNTLTLTPEPADPYVGGDGIQVSGQTISNAKPFV